MRRHGERVSRAQALRLDIAYRSVVSAGANDRRRQLLLDILPHDDHIATVRWVFADPAGDDASLRQTVSFVEGLLK